MLVIGRSLITSGRNKKRIIDNFFFFFIIFFFNTRVQDTVYTIGYLVKDVRLP